jgi:hypothetical protein
MTTPYKDGTITKNAGYGAQTQGNVLAALPLDRLFGAPFEAAAKAQCDLAHATAGFIRQFGMDICGNVFMTTMKSYYDIPTSSVSDISGGYLVDPSGGGIFCSQAVNTIITGVGKCTSQLTTSDKAPDSISGKSDGYQKKMGNRIYTMDSVGRVLFVQGMRAISVPFISLVNVPSLTLDEVTVDFTITIKTQESKQAQNSNSNTTENTSNNNVSVSVGGWFGFGGGGFNYNRQETTKSTAVSTSKNTATSDTATESTYTVVMKAKQIDPPGLTAIMQFITNNKDCASKKTTTAGKVVDDPASLRLV